MQEAARRTNGRNELKQRHQESFEDVSPEVGGLDAGALASLVGASPDEAASLLADMANATDRELRAKARRAAAQLYLRMARQGRPSKRGIRRLAADVDPLGGDLDLDATLARTNGLLPSGPGQIVTRRWSTSERAICLLIDRSGSMYGEAVARAAVAAAGVLVAAGERADCSVIAFAKDAVVLQEQGRKRPPMALLDDVLSLRGRGTTDLALALRAARRQLGRAGARERVVVLLSDAKATTGADPIAALRGLDRVHVLGTSDEPESVEAGQLLARRGGGSYRTCLTVRDIPRLLTALLDE